MSKTTALFHIVFCTKYRQMTISAKFKEDLYRYTWKIITDNKCKLLRIGGIANHIHILLDLNPTIALSDLVRDIKSRSSIWMRSDTRFSTFLSWAPEFFASSVSPENKNAVIEYIKNQKEHHLKVDFEQEMEACYHNSGLHFDSRDLI